MVLIKGFGGTIEGREDDEYKISGFSSFWYSNESNAEQYYLNLYWNTHLVQNRKETCISDEIY